MLTQQSFIKKYLRKHPNVTKKYAIKKYKKARRILFGTTNKRKNHDEPSSDDSDDTSYDDIRLHKSQKTEKTLREILQEHGVNNEEHFDVYARNHHLPLRPENYERIVQDYVDAIENGDVSPIESLSPDQRGMLREHPKCKLYKWMNEIAPNESIHHDINILTDDECRFYYMYEGLEYPIIDRIFKILIRARRGNSWALSIYPETVNIINVLDKKANTHLSDEEAIYSNENQLQQFLNHLSSSKYCSVAIDDHQYIFVKHPSKKNTIIIFNPHGIGANHRIVMGIMSTSLFGSTLQNYTFEFFDPHFSDQEKEGSCVLHTLTRMFYVAYNMRNKEYNMENLLRYFNKEKIPCQYAIFAQNLKYLAEQELNQPGTYESEETTIKKMNMNHFKDLAKKVHFIYDFKTRNPYIIAEINDYKEKFEDFREEGGTTVMEAFDKKFLDFEKYTDKIIRKITSGGRS
jgi:hypothetical protein